MKKFFWLICHYSGLRALYRLFNPMNAKTPATGVLWVVSLYLVFFVFALQRYENQLSRIQNKSDSTYTQINIRLTIKEAFEKIAVVHRMRRPIKPYLIGTCKNEIKNFECFMTLYHSLWSDQVPDEETVDSLKNILISFRESSSASGNVVEYDLSETDLRGANFGDMILKYTNFSGALLNGANFSGAMLTEANFSGADLTKTDLKGAFLLDVKLIEARLEGADFTDADLSYADLSGADLHDAVFSGTNFTNADLKGADFTGADLSWADLRGADLRDTVFSRTDFTDADLRGVDLSGANGITLEQINNATTDEATIPPENMN